MVMVRLVNDHATARDPVVSLLQAVCTLLGWPSRQLWNGEDGGTRSGVDFSWSFPLRGRPRRGEIRSAAGALPVGARTARHGPRCRRKASTPRRRGSGRTSPRPPGKLATRKSAEGRPGTSIMHIRLINVHLTWRRCHTPGLLDEDGNLSSSAPPSASIHRVFNTQESGTMGLDRIEADEPLGRKQRQGRYRSRA